MTNYSYQALRNLIRFCCTHVDLDDIANDICKANDLGYISNADSDCLTHDLNARRKTFTPRKGTT